MRNAYRVIGDWSELTPGVRYRVELDDCCVKGWFEATFQKLEVDSDDPDLIEAAVFDCARIEQDWGPYAFCVPQPPEQGKEVPPEPIAAGKRYRPVARLGYLTRVTRVARDQTWADIVIYTDGGSWSRRQPLVDGRFPYEVEEI
jgi:hypothetical protein